MSSKEMTTGLFVDVGSSTVKVGRSQKKPPTVDTIYYNNRCIVDVSSCMDNGSPRIKIVAGDDLQQIRDAIAARVTDVEEITDLSITSAKKPLYVWRYDQNGRRQEILILDDPSLTTELSDSEKTLIQQTLHLDQPIDPNNPLIKILSLKHNPRLVQFLFGEDATFNQLHFGSLTTFIRNVVTGEDNPKVGENYILAFGMNGCRKADVLELIKKLGLSDQLQFESEEFAHYQQTKIREGDDFRVELDTLKACADAQLFPPGSTIIGADSVGKVIHINSNNSPESWGRLDPKKIARYQTLRTFGQANNILKPLVADEAKQRNIPPEAVIDEVLKSGYPPKDWYFDPHGNGESGALYHRLKGGKWVEVPESELITNPHLKKHRTEIIRAVAWGVAFAIAELIPPNHNQGNIYVYGGLVGQYSYGENLGWRRVIRSVMPPNREVYLIRLSSAAVAMWITYMMQTGQQIDISQIITVEPLSGDNNRKTGAGVKNMNKPHFPSS